MDLMELGALGEMVGGIGVVVTLVYLATQVRHSTRIAEGGLYDQTEESWISTLAAVREDMDLFLRGSKNYRGLDEAESLRFAFLVAPILSHCENVYLKHLRLGMVRAEQIERVDRILTWYLTRPGVGEGFWSDYSVVFTDTFVDHVEGIRRKIAAGESGRIGPSRVGLGEASDAR